MCILDAVDRYYEQTDLALMAILAGKTPSTFDDDRDTFRCPRGYLWIKGKTASYCFQRLRSE